MKRNKNSIKFESDVLSTVISNLKKKHNFSDDDIAGLFESELVIPVHVLADRSLGALEAVVYYLRTEKNLSNNQIAKMLKRDNRTIWATYQKALGKKKK